jgi:aspartyl-tRNA(Asn)/glutamyl-tRNA(Gln) amidotransferase subunit C
MKDINHYAALAKLRLTPEEQAWMTARLNAYTQSFDALADIKTDGVKPLVSVLDVTNALREDAARQSVSRDTLLENAPEAYDGYFQVPKTVE